MTDTITKNTTSKAVNGSASSKAFPNLCSSVIPLKAVKRTTVSYTHLRAPRDHQPSRMPSSA